MLTSEFMCRHPRSLTVLYVISCLFSLSLAVVRSGTVDM